MIGLPERLQTQLAIVLSARPCVRRAILFGSRARGDARERSDVDLAIEAPGATVKEWMEIVEGLEGIETLLPMEAVRLEEAPEGLVERIEAQGRVIYERRE